MVWEPMALLSGFGLQVEDAGGVCSKGTKLKSVSRRNGGDGGVVGGGG